MAYTLQGSGTGSNTRIVYSQVEADELMMFGFKLDDTKLLDDGRTKYTLRKLGTGTSFRYKKKAEAPPADNDDDLDWLV